MLKIKRKVIQIAESTQLISLPRKWAKANNINRGDELDVVIDGNKLTINTDKEKVRRVSSVRAEDYPNIMPRVVSAFYRLGYDEVEIEYNNPSVVAPLLEILTEFFPGYEVLSQSEKRMVIKDIQYDVENEFDNVLRRLLMVTVSMGENILECMKNFNETRVLNVLSMENTNNRLANYCIRNVINRGQKEHTRMPFYVLFVWELEKIGDEFKYIGQYMIREDVKSLKISPATITLFEQLVEMFKMLVDAYYRMDPDKLDKIHMKRKEIIEEGLRLLESSQKKDRKIVHNIIVTSQKLANMSGVYMGIAF